MINFNHRFVPSVAAILQPLYEHVSGKKKLIEWTPKLEAAFNGSKEALARATMLVHPRGDAPTALTLDASDLAIGAMIEQLTEACWKPIAFFSKQQTERQSANTVPLTMNS